MLRPLGLYREMMGEIRLLSTFQTDKLAANMQPVSVVFAHEVILRYSPIQRARIYQWNICIFVTETLGEQVAHSPPQGLHAQRCTAKHLLNDTTTYKLNDHVPSSNIINPINMTLKKLRATQGITRQGRWKMKADDTNVAQFYGLKRCTKKEHH
ncbi:hypothetical protein T265_06478 [Opisthorchis viverrini]|uniref:Uncharacterized protein n=1 Tax=Opisthorchis viverrini TaxID=6198 RepID=A0A075ADQ7_OPIVI|nr:hypothetical protein T265_06478 [Opisthorchis viverrini]KER26194.1 hypothetical protein T265_06478 [Opisthorchis viverrini]